MMGTGDFAVPTFRALYETPHMLVELVTQPDRQGRGHHQGHVNRMKQVALERGTPVWQPLHVNTPESLAHLRDLRADVFVVAAYGQILSPELLGIPRLAAINVHASLLPRHRGAAPVAYAILKGDAETGVSIIQILPQLDAGPILAVARTSIGPRETAGQLEDRLAELSSPLVPEVLGQLAGGKTTPILQAAAQVTRAPKLKKEMGAIDWSQTARQIDCHVRAMQPWPNACTFLHARGKPPLRLLVLEVAPSAVRCGDAANDRPGAVVPSGGGRWLARCGDGAIELLRLQPEGKRPMSAAEFFRGRVIETGDYLAPG